MLKWLRWVVLVFLVLFATQGRVVHAGKWAHKVFITPVHEATTSIPEFDLDIKYKCGTFRKCYLNEFMKRRKVCVLFAIRAGKVVLHKLSPYADAECRENDRIKRHSIASITKSLTSLLFGRVLMDPVYGEPVNLDTAVSVALAEIGLNFSGRATLRDLLRMSSGLIWSDKKHTPSIRIEKDDNGNPVTYKTLIEAAARVLKDHKFRERNARPFDYSGFDSLLLGMLVEQRLKAVPDIEKPTLAKGLQHFIWQPFGMQRKATWKADFERHPPAYCCLYTGPGDMARLGYWVLERYLAGGTSGADLMAKWVRQSVDEKVTTEENCKFHGFRQNFSYGYQWWVLSGDRNGFTGLGVRGQFLHIFPERDIVIVQFSNWGEVPNWEYWEFVCESLLVHRVIAEKLAE
ncbi:MAG: serine hydrolase domain-containing protein [Alphaproteobacteria bacterium]|jgi:CubicO group peptidase (beta-lactamase class C family)